VDEVPVASAGEILGMKKLKMPPVGPTLMPIR
jgi:hypothetical protein